MNTTAIIVVAVLVVVYIGSYALNKSTPVPEECQDLAKEASCKSCSNFACGHKH